MKRLKNLLILLLAVLTLSCVGFACGGSGGGSDNVTVSEGKYYFNYNGYVVNTQFIYIQGNQWINEQGLSGVYSVKGDEITFTTHEDDYQMVCVYSKGVMSFYSEQLGHYYYCLDGVEPPQEPTMSGGNTSQGSSAPSVKVDINFNANGGKFSQDKTELQVKANRYSLIEAPENPTRYGYLFAGWSKTKSINNLWNFAQDKVTDGMTLFAVWKEQTAVVLSVEGGTVSETEINILVPYTTEMLSLSSKVVVSQNSYWKLYYDILGTMEIPTKMAASVEGALLNGANVFYVVVNSSDNMTTNVYKLTVYRSFPIEVVYTFKGVPVYTDTAYTGYEYSSNYILEKQGYNFNYWKLGEQKFVKGILNEPTVLVADYTCRTDTEYKVEYYFEDIKEENFSLREQYTKTLIGTTDSEVTVEIIPFDHFTATEKEFKGTIAGDGSTTIKVYYYRHYYEILLYTYVTEDLEDKAQVTGVEDGVYSNEETVELKITLNPGYEVVGWYNYDNNQLLGTNTTYSFNPTEPMAIYVVWQACTNTPYKVEYHLQNVSGSGYSVDNSLTKNLTGTTDTTVYAEIKQIEHFTAEKTQVSGNLNGDGSTVLKVYYTRNSYEIEFLATPGIMGAISEFYVDFNLNGATGTVPQTQLITKANGLIYPEIPTRNGYIFAGWYENDDCTGNPFSFSASIDSNVTLYAKWITPSNYENAISVGENKTISLSGTTVIYYPFIPLVSGSISVYTTSSIDTYGYLYNASKSSLTSNDDDGDGNNFKYTYNVTAGLLYYIGVKAYSSSSSGTATLYLTGTQTPTAGGKVVETTSTSCSVKRLYEQALPQQIANRPGYDFTGWFTQANQQGTKIANELGNALNGYVVCENVTLYAGWQVRTDTPYKVEYYLQNVSGNGYTADNSLTKNLTGTTDTTVYAEIKDIEHFTAEKTQVSGNLNGDGSTVLKVYYTRNSYTISLTAQNGNGSVSGGGEFLYDTSITISATGNTGYMFNGWYVGNELFSNSATYTFNVSSDINLITTFVDSRFVTSGNTLTGLTEEGKTIKNLVVPSIINGQTITNISANAFNNATFTSMTLPNSVTSIVSHTFKNCDSLTSVTIPDSVTSIGSSAFYGCTSLTSVNYTGDINKWVQISFGNSSANPLCYAEKLYINGEKVTNANITTATKISDYAFYNYSSLTSVTIGNSVTSIGSSALEDCDSLTSVTIPDSVTSIGSYAFWSCGKLYGVTIGDSVTSIGNSAFCYCSSLTSVTIGNSVTSIGGEGWAFGYCDSLTSVNYTGDINKWVQISFGSDEANPLYYAKKLYINGELVKSVNITTATKISDYAFYNCSSLTSVTIGNSVTSIGLSAFDHCSGLTSVTIGNSVTSIGKGAFFYCSNLTNVTIGDRVTSIGEDAFYGCSSLKTVYNYSSLTFTKGYKGYGCIAYYADEVYNYNS